jgi:hypothetical protein
MITGKYITKNLRFLEDPTNKIFRAQPYLVTVSVRFTYLQVCQIPGFLVYLPLLKQQQQKQQAVAAANVQIKHLKIMNERCHPLMRYQHSLT